MANAPQMKIPIQADTSDFDKGAKKVKQEMKDLNKVSSDALASIGNALGVDVGKLQQFSSALSGLGNKLAQTGREGTTAFGNISNSVASVAAGIAGLGLAAAIVAFKQLNAEADAFEQTIQGGIIKAQTEAYTSTVRQAIRDQQGTGKNFAGFRQYVKEVWADTMAAFQSGFNSDVYQAALNAGGRAKEIAGELYNLEIQRKNNSVEVSRLEAEIAKQREIMSDTTRTAAEREQALARAKELINQKANLQLPIERQIRNLIIEYNGLASTTLKDYDAEIAAKQSVNNLLTQQSTELRSLERQQGAITNAAEKERDARKEIADLSARWNLFLGDKLERVGGGGYAAFEDVSLAFQNFSTQIMADAQVMVPVKLAPPSQANRDEVVNTVTDISQELESIVASAAEKMGEIFGTLAADLSNGENAWQSFESAAVNAFADMAVAVGKIAIEAGTASLGIQKALQLSPSGAYMAIAAGVALVALGAYAKQSLANVASGNYAAGAGAVTSSSTNVGSYDYEQRDVHVNVTGTLTADGDELVAVINNTKKKNLLTT